MAIKVGGVAVAPPAKSEGNVLASVSRGRKKGRGGAVVLYGPPKIGKTTAVASVEAPLWLPTEDGLGVLDVPAMPMITSWAQLVAGVEAVAVEAHEYKSVIIDTLDHVERIAVEEVCKTTGAASIEDVRGGYGKGYTAVAELVERLLIALDRVRDRGITVVLIGHSQVKMVKDPSATMDYEAHTLDLGKKPAGIIRDWADAILFLHRPVYKKDETRIVMGERTIEVEAGPGFEAGNRWGLTGSYPVEKLAEILSGKGRTNGKN